jgi:hypothetical protein
VVVVIAPANDAALRAAVRERILAARASSEIEGAETIDPSILLSPPRSATPALAHVWIDFTHADRAVMLLLDEHFERGLLRYATRVHGDEIAREELGEVLETALEGLLAGEKIGVTREELTRRTSPIPPIITPVTPHAPALVRKRAPPVTPPPARSPWGARGAFFYAVDAFGADTASHGPGLALDVLYDAGRARVGPSFSLQERVPATIDVAPITLRVESWAARAMFDVVVPAGGFSIDVALGAGFDLVHAEPLAALPGTSITRSTTAAFPIGRARIAIGWARPRISLGVTFDVDPSERYVYLINGQATPLFAANVVRPGLEIAIGTP